jgi:PAS domain S-box-containing protein
MTTGQQGTPLLASIPTTAFLNIFPDAVIIVDPARRITVCNDAACRLFGYSTTTLIGLDIERLVPPKVQEYHHLLVAKVFDDMVPRELANRKPVHGRHSSGRLFTASVQLIPCLLQLDGDEAPRKFVWCIARDMSGYNKAMHDRQQAEQHSALVGKFLRLLNHEVCTSLHAITNALDTLSHELDDAG